MAKPTNAAIVDLKGRKWQPFETQDVLSGYVTYTPTDGEIHVPYGTDPVSLMIQAHELSHVRYTAKLWPDAKQGLRRLMTLSKAPQNIVGYAEDMRITALAGRLNLKTLPEFGNKLDEPIITRWVESFVAAGVPESRVQKAIRFILNDHTTVLRTIGLDRDTLQQRENAERYIAYCAQQIHNLLKRDAPDKGNKSQQPQPSPEKAKDPAPAGDDESQDGDSQPEGDEGDEPQDGEEGDKSEGDDSRDGEDGDDSEAGDSGGDDTEGDEEEGDGEGSEGSDGDSDDEGDTEGDSETEGDGADREASDSDSEADSVSGNAEGGDPSGGADGDLDIGELNLPDLKAAMLASVPAPQDTAKLVQTFQHTLNTADWIPVEKIDRMPLVRRAAQARKRGRKLSETGVALGSAYDAVAPNERRPFLSKRKGGVGGLTVVIDCSGSMSIQPKELEHLLLKHPQGVVVTYSSRVGRLKSDNKAIVRVIASHGRLAATEDFRDNSAMGNGCDGPVLEWLAKQPGERVWICDGCITGKGDKVVYHDSSARAAWLKAHRIQQFYSLKTYLESLT